MQVRRITREETVPLRQSVLRPGMPLSDSRYSGDELARAGHYGVFETAWDGDELIAVGSIYPEACPDAAHDKPGAWRLRGMATDPRHRSRGAGELVLKACMEHVRSSGGSMIWCHARTGAKNFYLRHGFIPFSDEYVLPGIGPHFLMKWIP